MIALGYEISAARITQAVAARLGPVRNQAKTKHARPTSNAAIPCFT